MSTSTNPHSYPTAPIEKFYIVSPTPSITPNITRSELDYAIKYSHTDTKAYIDKTDTNMKSMSDYIASMLTTLIDTSVKTNN